MKLGNLFAFALTTLALNIALNSTLVTSAHAADFSSTILHHVEIQNQLKERHVAIVALDGKNEVLSVSIIDDVCGKYAADGIGSACLAMPVSIANFELPYTKTVDRCGAATFEASEDKRPVDGNFVTVRFVDNSTDTCQPAVAPVQVLNIDVVSPRGSQVRYFAANTTAQLVRDDRAIYEALNVEEVDLNPGIAGSRRTQKSVGGLTCTKSLTIVPRAKPSYSCSLAD